MICLKLKIRDLTNCLGVFYSLVYFILFSFIFGNLFWRILLYYLFLVTVIRVSLVAHK